MIFIFAAHYGEVENIIKQKKMGKRKISFPFLQYCTDGWNESGAKKEQKQAGKERSCMKESASADGRILLTICGEGRNNAAAAVAATLAKEEAKKGDILLSIGSAAMLKGVGEERLLGKWFLIHALEEEGSGRAFYPELLYQTDFPTARLITGDKVLRRSDATCTTETKSYSSTEKEISPVSNRGQENVSPFGTNAFMLMCGERPERMDTEETLLYDMESTAVFQSANAFLSLENLFFLRCSTDFGVGELESGQHGSGKTVPEMLREQMRKEEEKVFSFLSHVEQLDAEKEKEREKEEAFLRESTTLAEELRLSFVLAKKLEGLLSYAESLSSEWRAYFQKKREEGLLPCRDKRGGQKVLSDFTAWLLLKEKQGEQSKEEMAQESEKALPLYPPFSHIYVEEELLGGEEVQAILKKFPKAKCIPIRHYKDLFNRRKQNRALQEKSRKLILAKKEGQRIYPGAPVCQSFSESAFYYASLLMNCPFHCEYCYLQGMYPSANLVLFLNLEDYFSDCRRLIKEKGSLYLCISYDTDLLALEELYPFVERFARFLEEEPDLRIEVRTKAGGESLFRRLLKMHLSEDAKKRLIFAFTLSPEKIVSEAEHGTAGLKGRLKAVKMAMEEGFTLRLCFDPMLYHADWKSLYTALLETVFREIPMEKLYDVSVGSFRISESYLKAMTKSCGASPYTSFPYENTDGYYHYPKELLLKMEGFLEQRLLEKLPKEKIFRWTEEEK
ncbi:SPL family radical SAM protein [Oribacterium asaccharolyticum]|uniref:SPL family radical SAM protein n=1 Tax=Oribacterium asaccharolyticum TaxID=1501332 RepID=UPI0028ED1C55|nr:radical SAM protein [Oribacterium asaccharolyticum]